ncbi:hypothetical protein TIFTF001_053864, partial [Ficus carica]
GAGRALVGRGARAGGGGGRWERAGGGRARTGAGRGVGCACWSWARAGVYELALACAGSRWAGGAGAGFPNRRDRPRPVRKSIEHFLLAGPERSGQTGLTGPGQNGPIRTEFLGPVGPDKIFSAQHERLGRSCRFGTPKSPTWAVRPVRTVRKNRSRPASKNCSLVYRTGLTGNGQFGPDQPFWSDRDRSGRSGPAGPCQQTKIACWISRPAGPGPFKHVRTSSEQKLLAPVRDRSSLSGPAGPALSVRPVRDSEQNLLVGFLDRPDRDRSGKTASKFSRWSNLLASPDRIFRTGLTVTGADRSEKQRANLLAGPDRIFRTGPKNSEQICSLVRTGPSCPDRPYRSWRA